LALHAKAGINIRKWLEAVAAMTRCWMRADPADFEIGILQ
jgi:hypothetical protein